MCAMTIEIYGDHHHDGVVDLWREVFPNPSPWNEPEAVILKKRQVQPELFFVALENDRIIGTTIAGYDGHRGWLYSLGVSPAWRRKGIATSLVTHAERVLTKLGCAKLNLQVRVPDNGAAAFYRSLGFEIEDRISMGKRLDRGPAGV